MKLCEVSWTDVETTEGVNPSIFSKWENRNAIEASPTLQHTIAFEMLLGVSIDYLLFYFEGKLFPIMFGRKTMTKSESFE